MITEADRLEMQKADREIDRKDRESRGSPEARRAQIAKATRSWRARNPEKSAAYAANYRKMHREEINQAHREMYRAASAAAVPNEELAAWRMRLGIRQNAAAKLLGVSQASYSTWENGLFPAPVWVMERIREEL